MEERATRGWGGLGSCASRQAGGGDSLPEIKHGEGAGTARQPARHRHRQVLAPQHQLFHPAAVAATGGWPGKGCGGRVAGPVSSPSRGCSEAEGENVAAAVEGDDGGAERARHGVPARRREPCLPVKARSSHGTGQRRRAGGKSSGGRRSSPVEPSGGLLPLPAPLPTNMASSPRTGRAVGDLCLALQRLSEYQTATT